VDSDRFFRIGLITLLLIATALMIWALLGFPKAAAGALPLTKTDKTIRFRAGISPQRDASAKPSPGPIPGLSSGHHKNH
jgi:hypothetical protein